MQWDDAGSSLRCQKLRRRHAILIDDAQVAKAPAYAVVVFANEKTAMGIQSSVLGVAAIFGASDGSHPQLLSASKASTTSSID